MKFRLSGVQFGKATVDQQPGQSVGARPILVVLVGNPNCGKTTLFNALTGLRAKVANYAGVTVERKEGRLDGDPAGRHIPVLDLPGAYSLSPQSADEQIVRDVLLQHCPEVPAPDLVVIVVDASNLERNLYFATQVIELGYPTVMALNMMDVARENGRELDPAALSKELGIRVFPMVANTRQGVTELRNYISAFARAPSALVIGNAGCKFPPEFVEGVREIAQLLPRRQRGDSDRLNAAEAGLILTDERYPGRGGAPADREILKAVLDVRRRLETKGIDWRTVAIDARYAYVETIKKAAVRETVRLVETRSDKIDRVLTHRIWGTLVFLLVMAGMFQSIFTFANVPTRILERGVGWAGLVVGNLLGPGELRSLVVDGVIAGVGAVIVFLPQICLLFLFIGILEESGYMSRAAFLMDGIMSRVGLHGKSFIPLLSSFACAVPGIMAARTIEHSKQRLVTILIAPLMSCSARLPVYTLLIAACIPDRKVLGPVRLPGLTLLGLYVLGVVVAFALAWVSKKTILKSHLPLMILELPPYRRPALGALLRHVWERVRSFLQRAGTVILGINILLWFLASYPRNSDVERSYAIQRQQLIAQAGVADGSPTPGDTELQSKLRELENQLAGERLRGSFVGRLGRVIEPLIAPLGFDWKIGIGILSSFAARELFVSTIAVVYNVGSARTNEGPVDLVTTLRAQKRPDGTPVYSLPTGLALLVFYAIALQCAGTLTIIYRETNSLKWTLVDLVCLGTIAWLLAFAAYNGARALGWQ